MVLLKNWIQRRVDEIEGDYSSLATTIESDIQIIKGSMGHIQIMVDNDVTNLDLEYCIEKLLFIVKDWIEKFNLSNNDYGISVNEFEALFGLESSLIKLKSEYNHA